MEDGEREPTQPKRRVSRALLVAAALCFFTSAAFAGVTWRQRAADADLRARGRAAFDAVVRVNRELLEEKLPAAAADPAKADDALRAAVHAADVRLGRLKLPVPTGRFEDDARTVREAVTAERAFLGRLQHVLSSTLVDVEDGDLEELDDSWDKAARAVGRLAELVDRPVPPPQRKTTVVHRLGVTLGEAAESARDALRDVEDAVRDRDEALSSLQEHHDAVEELFASYERMREALSNQKNRERTITSYSDEADFRSAYEEAAQARRELAESIAALEVPPSLAAQQAAVVSTIVRQADVVEDAGGAASEAYCYPSFFSPTTERCPTIGDTVLYRDYLRQGAALYEEFVRARDAVRAAYEAEVRRLYAG